MWQEKINDEKSDSYLFKSDLFAIRKKSVKRIKVATKDKMYKKLIC